MLREEAQDIKNNVQNNRGTSTSVNAAKQTETIFLTHSNPVKERKKIKAQKEATFKKVIKLFKI